MKRLSEFKTGDKVQFLDITNFQKHEGVITKYNGILYAYVDKENRCYTDFDTLDLQSITV